MPETSDRLAGYGMILGLIIIFGTMFYATQYFLVGMILGGGIMVIPTFGSEYFVRLELAHEHHITSIIRPAKNYKGSNQHWYFKSWQEDIMDDGLNHVILFLSRVWLHPLKGKVWYIELRMKGKLEDRAWFQHGPAVLHGTAGDHGATDRCVFDEMEYDIPGLDPQHGPMPVFNLITGSKDEGQLFDVINSGYTPMSAKEKEAKLANSNEEILAQVIRDQKVHEVVITK